MKALFLAAVLFISAAPVQGRAGSGQDYPQILSEAMLKDAQLPPAPAGFEDSRHAAQGLIGGRPQEESVEDFEARVRNFCRELGLDGQRTAALAEHLRGRVRFGYYESSKGDQGFPGARRGIESSQGRAMSASAADHAAALGFPAYESAQAGMAGARIPARSNAVLKAWDPQEHRKEPSVPDQALSWEQINKVVVFRRVPEEEESWRDRLARWNPLAEPDPAELFARKALSRMQETPEGREVLRKLVQEYGRSGRKVFVHPQDFPGSTIVYKDGREGLRGTRGMAWYSDDPKYEFNRMIMDFNDHDAARDFLAANMSHEFRHMVNKAVFQRLSSEQLDIFYAAFLDEQRARQTGYLVAARLNYGKASDYSEEASELAADPDLFWEEMRSWSSYVVKLVPDEMKDPVSAYSQRLKVVAEQVEEMRGLLKTDIPRLMLALDIMSRQEGLSEQTSELRSQTQGRSRRGPSELEAYEKDAAGMRKSIRLLESAKGRAKLEAFKKASELEGFRVLEEERARDQKALEDSLRAHPLPKSERTPGQLSTPEFWARARESAKKHPEYWAEFIKKYGEIPKE
ncbi:MAG: hypothetical protein WCU88_03570 [Elusimicrobiota bacterium]|jgi:hypothetical protein